MDRASGITAPQGRPGSEPERNGRGRNTGPPATRGQVVDRTALVERLLTSVEPVVSIIAPPGYGKTTLLGQWAARLPARVAWVSCERSDNDPVRLWDDILSALGEVDAVPAASAALAEVADGNLVAVAKLVRILADLAAPVVLVLDHLEMVTNPYALASVAELAHRLPPQWRLALASRDVMPLPVARMRVQGRILELGAADLRMTVPEGRALLRQAGADLPAVGADDLVERTEGWPAGLYLAALAINSGVRAPGFAFAGDDRFVEDYLRSELLSHVSSGDLRFMVRTSILDQMSGPLCDAVVGGGSSARTLRLLEERNLLVIPLDRRGEWYRYHHLFRELLRAELDRSSPELVAGLHSRAAHWFSDRGIWDAAIDHAAAAGDSEWAARIMLTNTQEIWAASRIETVRAWLGLFEDPPSGPYAVGVAAHGALIFALLGRVGEAERWVRFAESAPVSGTLPDGNTVAATLAYLSAILCREGPDQMWRDAERALQGLAPTSPYRATMVHTQALCCLIDGDLDRADELFAQAYDLAMSLKASPLGALDLAERSLIAAARGATGHADVLVKQAVGIVESGHVESYWSSALVFAAAARVALKRADLAEARQFVRRTAVLRPLLTHALPVVSLQVLIELANVYLAIADPAGARAVVEQGEAITLRRPDLGSLSAELARLRDRLDTITRATPLGLSSLTIAEMRLVPLLPTHLSFPEIAEHLYVSRNTVRSQAQSIYRKLGVSSRSEAVDRLAELGRR